MTTLFNKYLFAFIFILGITSTTTAFAESAQEKPFYATFNGGQLDFDDDILGNVESDTYALALGWQPIPYLSVEFSYSFHDYKDGNLTRGMRTISYSGDGYALELLTIITPIEYRIRPIIMLGASFVEKNLNASDNEFAEGLNDSEFDIVYGAGFDFDITDTIGFRAGYKRTGSNIDYDGWFLGPIVRF